MRARPAPPPAAGQRERVTGQDDVLVKTDPKFAPMFALSQNLGAVPLYKRIAVAGSTTLHQWDPALVG